MCPSSGLQEYSEWKKEAADISLPGVYIGLMDRLNSFSRVIMDSTQELCSLLVSSYVEKVKETCKNGETREEQRRAACVRLGVLKRVKNFLPIAAEYALKSPVHESPASGDADRRRETTQTRFCAG